MAEAKAPAAKPTATKPAATNVADKKPAAAPATKPAAKPAPPKKPSGYEPLTYVKDFNDRLQLCGARYSPCGKFVIGGSMIGSVLRWDATTDDFAPLPDWTGHGGFVSGLAFGPKGSNRVYTADSWGRLRAYDYTTKNDKPLWDVADAHAGWLHTVACSPDGQTIATCGYDQAVRLWDAATGKKIADLPGHKWDVLSVEFSPDGKTLASGDLSGLVKLWDVAAKKSIRDLDAAFLYVENRLQDVGGARVLRFTLDGKTLIVGGTAPKNGGNVQGEPTLALYDPQTGKQTKKFKLGEAKDIYVFDVVCHPGGYWIVVTSGNPGSGQLLLLRPGEEKPFFTSTKVANLHSVDLHADGRRFIVTAINPANAGNGAVKNKETAKYVSNFSPIKVFELPETFGPAA